MNERGQIAGARDRLIQAYFKVDLDAVWSMVEHDLPTLRQNVRRIQGDRGPAWLELPAVGARGAGVLFAPWSELR